MNDKKDYQVLWEGFISNKKMLLNEMEGQYMNLISNATAYAERHPELLPFKEVFGNDLRKVIPFQQKNVDKIAYLLSIFKLFSRTTEGKQYLVPQVQPTTVKVKRQRQDGETYEQKQTLNQLVAVHTFIDQMGNSKTRNLTIVNSLKLLNGAYKKYLEKSNQDPDSVNLPQFTILKVLDTIPRMIDWWQKNQSKIIQDPEIAQLSKDLSDDMDQVAWKMFDTIDENEGAGEINSKYSIILSRVPVDVLRMSDHDGISSCHSQPKNYGSNGYFYCAIAEAQNQGAIAYVVNTEDLENIDLKSKEIFVDRERSIGGIRPLSRIRLRTLKDTSTDKTIAVPEQKIYGLLINGFQEFIDKYTAQSQKEMFVEQDEDGTKQLKLPIQSNLTYVGGSWQDSLIGRNFKRMLDYITGLGEVEPTKEQKLLINDFALISVRYSGNDDQYQDDDEDEDYDEDNNDEDDQREAAEQEYYEQIRRGGLLTDNSFIFRSSNFNWVWGEGVELKFVAYTKIPIETSSLSKKYFVNGEVDTETLCSDILSAIVDKADKSDVKVQLDYPDAPIDKSETYIQGDKDDKYLTLNLFYIEDDISDEGTFSSHISDFIQFYNSIDSLEDTLKVYLIDNGIISDGTVSISQRIANLKNSFDRDKQRNFTYIGGDRFEFRPITNTQLVDSSKAGVLLTKINVEDYRDIRHNFDSSFNEDIVRSFVREQEKTLSSAYNSLQQNLFDNIPANYLSEFTEQEKFSFLGITGAFSVELKFVYMTEDMKTAIVMKDSEEAKIVGIYAVPVITINSKKPPETLLGLINYMYMVDEDPEQFIDLLYLSFKIAASQYSDLNNAISKLTERRKRVIKERLKNWYRKNKGII